MRNRLTLYAAAAGMVFLAGCTMGPNYKRPAINAPATYRSDPAPPAADIPSLGDEKWWQVFKDEELQKLVRQAIENNYDVRIAASRILEAQAQVGITRADQLPSLSASAGVNSLKFPVFSYTIMQVQGAFSWTPDFWGRYRRATEAARAQLLGSEWNRKQVIGTLVADVATAYFTLRELDLELEISRRTLTSRQESLKLTQTLESGGAAALVDVRQAEQLVETAAGAIPDLERQIAQAENLLSTLMGDNPHDVTRGLPLDRQPLPESVPAGLPSRLLARRPDIQAAEQQLVAANAQIGVARAAFFPELSLTGSGGVQSNVLGNLFSADSGAWSFSPVITQPIFQGGRLKSNLRLAEATRQEMIDRYKQTIQQAFREVSDALIAYQKDREFTDHQRALTAAAADAARLSDLRYRGGAASYLEVLSSETNHYSAQLTLARAQLSQRVSLVQFYSALGGGWEQ